MALIAMMSVSFVSCKDKANEAETEVEANAEAATDAVEETADEATEAIEETADAAKDSIDAIEENHEGHSH